MATKSFSKQRQKVLRELELIGEGQEGICVHATYSELLPSIMERGLQGRVGIPQSSTVDSHPFVREELEWLVREHGVREAKSVIAGRIVAGIQMCRATHKKTPDTVIVFERISRRRWSGYDRDELVEPNRVEPNRFYAVVSLTPEEKAKKLTDEEIAKILTNRLIPVVKKNIQQRKL